MQSVTVRANRFSVTLMAGLLCLATVEQSCSRSEAPKLTIDHPSESLAFLPFYVARDKQFFQKAGVSVDLITVGASNFYPALFSGQTQTRRHIRHCVRPCNAERPAPPVCQRRQEHAGDQCQHENGRHKMAPSAAST